MAAQLRRFAVLLCLMVSAMGVTLNYGVQSYYNITAGTTAGSADVVISGQPAGVQQFAPNQIIAISGVTGYKIVDSMRENGNPATVSTTLTLLNADRTPFQAASTASGLTVRFIGDELDHTSVRIWATTDVNACISFWFDVEPHTSGSQYRYRSGETNCNSPVSAVAIVGLAPSTTYYFRANVKTVYGTDNSTACSTDVCGALEFTLRTPVDPHEADGRPPMPAEPEPVAAQVSAPLDTTGYEIVPVPAFPDGVVTGSIANGSTTLTVNTVPAGMAADQYIVINGVTCPAHNFGAPWCKIASISGNTITLAAAVDATVTNAAVSYGILTIVDQLYYKGKRFGTVYEFKQGYKAKWWPTNGAVAQDALNLYGFPPDTNPHCASTPCSIDDPAHRWIVFRTASSPAELPSDGVRTGPEFAAILGGIATQGPSRAMRLTEGNFGQPSHHYRIENFEFTMAPSDPADTDPAPRGGALGAPAGYGTLIPRYIVLDRVYAHTPDLYTRTTGLMEWSAKQGAILNSYLSADYWRPYLFHFGPDVNNYADTRFSGNTLSIGGMQWQRNKFEPLVNQGPATLTAFGTATGSVQIYGVMDPNFPSGVRVLYTSGRGISINCPNCGGGVAAVAAPAVATNTRVVFSGVISTGGSTITCTEYCNGNGTAVSGLADSKWITEGPNGVYFNDGDHWLLENNHVEVYNKGFFADIPTSLVAQPPSHITIRRNHFFWNQDHRRSSSSTNGFWYQVRHNGIEFKRGTLILIEGNEFEGGWSRINHGAAVVFSQTAGNYWQPIVSRMGDITVRYNVFHTQAEIIGSTGHEFNNGIMGADTARLYFGYNLIYDQNAFRQQELPSPAFFGKQGLFGGHDVIVEHNSWYDSKSNFPLFDVGGGDRPEGHWFQNNIWYMNRDGFYAFQTQQADNGTLIMKPPPVLTWGQPGSTTFDVGWNSFAVRLAETVVPSMTFTNNVIVCGAQLGGATGVDVDLSQADCDAYRDQFGAWAATNFFPRGPTRQDREQQLGMVNPSKRDFSLKAQSQFASGAKKSTDGLDAGVRFTALQDRIGVIQNVVAQNITRNAATIHATTPDVKTACRVAYGTGAPSSWAVSTANTAGTKDRLISLSGLQSGATYHYQIWCAGVARSATYEFRTF